MSPTFTTFKSPEKAIISVNNLQMKNRMKKLSLNQQSLGIYWYTTMLSHSFIIGFNCYHNFMLDFFSCSHQVISYSFYQSQSICFYFHIYLIISIYLYLNIFASVLSVPYLIHIYAYLSVLMFAVPYLFKSVLMYHI